MPKIDIAHEEFWSRVQKTDNCWLWTGTVDKDGYWQIVRGKRCLRTHRVSFYLTHGRWPEPCALHRCDVRLCVRPDHIFEGTRATNMADMIAKGRQVHPSRPGELVGTSKLKESDIHIIRKLISDGLTIQDIANRFGVHFSNISCIKRGKTWRHVP